MGSVCAKKDDNDSLSVSTAQKPIKRLKSVRQLSSKVLIIGEPFVGKTSLVNMWCNTIRNS